MSIFKGMRTNSGKRVTVDNVPLNLRLDIISYAPGGFDWGYDGMGSAQLALAILAQELDTGAAITFHEAFQRQVINRLNHDEWMLDSSQIESHIAEIKKAKKEDPAEDQAKSLNVIIIEPSFAAADRLFGVLSINGYQGQSEFPNTINEFNQCLNEQLWDLILVNPETEDNILATITKTLVRNAVDIPTIAVPEQADVMSVVEAMRLGAKDLVLKSAEQHLLLVIQRELDSLAARRERDRLQSASRQTEKTAPKASIRITQKTDNPKKPKATAPAGALKSQPAPVQSLKSPSLTADETTGDAKTQSSATRVDIKTVLAAISANRLNLAYQPIVSLGEEVEKIYEIFPRLSTTDGQEIPSRILFATLPANMSNRLDHQIIERAGKLLIEQQIAGDDVSFFVKLSNQAVNNDSVIQQIEQLIFSNALDPQRLTLEFPEKAVADHLPQAQKMMQALDQLGCSSALYDCGLLAYAADLIEQIDIRYIKLVGSLATKLIQQPQEAERKLQALQKAAKNKNAIIIASEVNDVQLVSTLWKYGIDFIQGNHIQEPQSKPDYDFD